MKKIISFITILFLASVLHLFIYTLIIKAKEPPILKILSLKEIIHNMTEKYDKIRTFRAKFKIKSIVNNVKKVSKGEIKYKKPDMFIMLFDEPKGQIIFSDGKILKIYVPELNVLGEQNLKDYQPGFFITTKSSLSYLKSKYNFSFYKSTKPKIIGGNPYYRLLLAQKEVTAGFKNIVLYVSKYWIITKAIGTTIDGDQIDISFYDITINKEITSHEFEFNLPVNTQTVKNPLFYKSEGE